MASARQIAANRKNAQKSTGPRSEIARSQLRLHALRHGLAIPIGNDPAYQEDIEKLARTLSDGTQGDNGSAREAAKAELDLLRIQKVRTGLFDKLYRADTPDGLTDLNDKLSKLERYERRAFSRRKRALRAE